MRRLLVVATAAVIGFAVLPTAPAAAHPMGNFSVNRYAGLSVHPDRIDALAVADVAELPTLQDPPASCAEASAALVVTVNGAGLEWTVTGSSLMFASGAGGLRTSRLECRLSAPAAIGRSAEVSVTNRFRDDRIGWRELVAAAGSGVRLVGSPLPAVSVSDELRNYPKDLLSSPSDVRSARFTAVPGAGSAPVAAAAPGVSGAGSAPVAAAAPGVSGVRPLGLSGPLAGAERWLDEMVGGQRLTPLVGLLAVLLALVLGAAHAALPGHGKTVMAAYLAGSRGRTRDAVAVGATVTLTHTGGVLALGLLLTTVAGVAGEAVLGWLGFASGALVVAVGVGALVSAIRRRRGWLDSHEHADAQDDAHTHGQPDEQDPGHSHDKTQPTVHTRNQPDATAHSHTQPDVTAHSHTQPVDAIHNHHEIPDPVHNQDEAHALVHNNHQAPEFIHSRDDSHAVVHNQHQALGLVHNHGQAHVLVHNHDQAADVVHNDHRAHALVHNHSRAAAGFGQDHRLGEHTLGQDHSQVPLQDHDQTHPHDDHAHERECTRDDNQTPGSDHDQTPDRDQTSGQAPGPDRDRGHDHAHLPALRRWLGHRHTRGLEHTRGPGQAHGPGPVQEHGHTHEAGHGHTHGPDHAHGNTHEAGHEHGHEPDHAHGNTRGPGRHGHMHGPGRGHGHTHGLGHGHTHGPGHGHDHGVGKWGIAGMGIAGGLVPSPSALIVLLGAMALGRTVFGVLLVIAYGLGMAATLTAAGLLLVRLRDRLEGRLRFVARWRAVAPSATAALIILVGLGLAGRALSALA